MPNGKPGDHPISDITIHNIPTYGWKADCLILDCVCLIDKLIVTGKLARPVYFYEKLDEACNWFNPPDTATLLGNLTDLKEKLTAEYNGK